jgi:hypothetical protein
MSATIAEKARAAWGRRPPDWIRVLVESCEEHSLRGTAEKLNLSPASVSLAVNRKRENLDFIKAKVETVLMVTIVTCPVMGVMGKADCEREQAKPFSSANPLRVQLYRACRNGCPHFRGGRTVKLNQFHREK